MKNISKALSGILSFIFLVSCQTYQPLELDSKKILEEINNFRNIETMQTTSFNDLAMLMSERNNTLKLLKGEYKKHRKVAELSTPWHNPEIEFGPAFGSRLEDTAASSTQPFIGIGFTIPLGSKLLRNDELNKAKEILAYNNLILEHRQLYFDLKKVYIELMLNQQKQDALYQLKSTLNLSRKITEKLIEIGTSTKLGLTQVDLQLAKLSLQELELKNERTVQLQGLASLLEVNLNSLQQLKLNTKSFPNSALPKSNYLKNLMINNNPFLSKQELAFHLADKELKLELAKQYPDLKVGLSQEQEVGEKKRTISIPFSIELPVFDRNQQAITSSLTQREIELDKYKQTLSHHLSLLEAQIESLKISKQKDLIVTDKILPLTEMNSKDAEKALKLGSISTLRYLDILAQHLEFKLNISDLNQEKWQALLNIEITTGSKLFHLDVDDPHKFEKSLKNIEVNK
ncbi:MAG: TolC family protein [Lentisphaeraceae bacterium]|nr:TolC family protein [Lentisphaeraceae bacterium]